MSARSARMLLRSAAALATLQAIAHLTLFLRGQPGPGSAAWPLVQAMKAQNGTGTTTYWGMYFGYGLLSALTAFFVAALIIVAATFDDGSRRLTRTLILIVLVAVALHALVISRYFFALPLYFDIIVATLLVLAWTQLGEESAKRA